MKRSELLINANDVYNNGIHSKDYFLSAAKEKNIDKMCFVKPLEKSVAFTNEQNNIFETTCRDDTCKITINESNQKLDDGWFVIYDIETSGLFGWFDNITEIGAIKVKLENGKVVKQEIFDVLVKQDKPLKPFIANLTHISDKMLKEQGIDEKEAIKKFFDFCKDDKGRDIPCLGHNIINFDWRFFNKKCEKHNIPMWKNPQIDTVQISKLLYNRPNHQLKTLASDLNIQYDPNLQHRADADAKINLDVYLGLVKELNKKGIKTIADLNKNRNSNFYSQQRQHSVILFVNNKAESDLFKLTQEKSRANETIKNCKNITLASAPIGGDILDGALTDRDSHFQKRIANYDVILLPPPSVLSNYLSDAVVTKNVDISGYEEVLNNISTIKQTLNGDYSTKNILKCLMKLEIINEKGIPVKWGKGHKWHKGDLFDVVKMIKFFNDPDFSYSLDSNYPLGGKPPQSFCEFSYTKEAPLTMDELHKVYKYIFDSCKKQNKDVVIACDTFSNKEEVEEIGEFCKSKGSSNKFNKMFKVVNPPNLNLKTPEEIKKEFDFYKDRIYINQIVCENSVKYANELLKKSEHLTKVSKEK